MQFVLFCSFLWLIIIKATSGQVTMTTSNPFKADIEDEVKRQLGQIFDIQMIKEEIMRKLEKDLAKYVQVKVAEEIQAYKQVQDALIGEFDQLKFRVSSLEQKYVKLEATCGRCHQDTSPEPAGWSLWGSWTPCSSSCGSGTRARSRTCNSPTKQGTCQGESAETQTCQGQDCAGQWEAWSAWSSCTQLCGGGTQARFRNCSSDKCLGDDNSTQIIECNNHKCSRGDAVWKSDFESLCFDFSTSISNGLYTWRLQMGKTSSIGTGPSWDHTTGQGFYMVADASLGLPGGHADYVSTPMQSTEPWYCLSMWYHMYGQEVNRLTVYSIQNNTKEILFNKRGNLGDQWNHFTRSFSMKVGVNFMIQLRATRGQDYRGDIAIDDIVVTSGKCKDENGANNGHKLSQWNQWSQCGGAPCGTGTRTRERRCQQEPCDHIQLRQRERCSLPRQCVACGRASPQLIIGGRESVEGKWPWQVGLYIQPSDALGAAYGHLCGASILTQRFILTAAHCLVQQSKGGLVPININRTMAMMGSIYMLVGGTRHTIKRLIPHPGFNFSSAMNDIALMELNSAITYNHKIRPICLPTLPHKVGKRCYVTGWGRIGPYSISPGSHTLKEVQQTIKSEQWCERKYQGQEGTTFQRNSHFCAGPSIETDVSSMGDSGGPFSCLEDDGYHVQGVVSIGNPIEGRPSAYTDIYHFLPWIKNIIY